jgi:hypothetical protein
VNDFWSSRLAAENPASQQQLSLGDQYRAFQRAKAGGNGASGSGIYALPTLPEQRAAAAARRPSRYVENPYQGLESYPGKQADTLGRRPGESTESWRRRGTAP